MKKKTIFAALIAFITMTAVIFAFAANKERISVRLAGGEPEDKVIVVATLFPHYDFACQIAGDRAEAVLLLTPGVESHSYEPTPSDVVRIGQSRVFLHTGEENEPWVKRLTSGFERGQKPLMTDVSQGITPSSPGAESSADHSYKEHADNSHRGETDSVGDPHIWTDPNNAMIMTKNVLAALVAVDPKNQDYYRENARNYIAELVSLDKEIREMVKTAERRELVLGGRNAMHYFLKRYGLKAHSAFDSCSAEQEPSVRTIAALKDILLRKNFPVVYYEELQAARVAKTLIEGTEAKLLLLHSIHNLSKEDFEAGKTYIVLMRQNLENLKAGLN